MKGDYLNRRDIWADMKWRELKSIRIMYRQSTLIEAC